MKPCIFIRLVPLVACLACKSLPIGGGLSGDPDEHKKLNARQLYKLLLAPIPKEPGSVKFFEDVEDPGLRAYYNDLIAGNRNLRRQAEAALAFYERYQEYFASRIPGEPGVALADPFTFTLQSLEDFVQWRSTSGRPYLDHEARRDALQAVLPQTSLPPDADETDLMSQDFAAFLQFKREYYRRMHDERFDKTQAPDLRVWQQYISSTLLGARTRNFYELIKTLPPETHVTLYTKSGKRVVLGRDDLLKLQINEEVVGEGAADSPQLVTKAKVRTSSLLGRVFSTTLSFFKKLPTLSWYMNFWGHTPVQDRTQTVQEIPGETEVMSISAPQSRESLFLYSRDWAQLLGKLITSNIPVVQDQKDLQMRFRVESLERDTILGRVIRLIQFKEWRIIAETRATLEKAQAMSYDEFDQLQSLSLAPKGEGHDMVDGLRLHGLAKHPAYWAIRDATYKGKTRRESPWYTLPFQPIYHSMGYVSGVQLEEKVVHLTVQGSLFSKLRTLSSRLRAFIFTQAAVIISLLIYDEIAVNSMPEPVYEQQRRVYSWYLDTAKELGKDLQKSAENGDLKSLGQDLVARAQELADDLGPESIKEFFNSEFFWASDDVLSPRKQNDSLTDNVTAEEQAAARETKVFEIESDSLYNVPVYFDQITTEQLEQAVENLDTYRPKGLDPDSSFSFRVNGQLRPHLGTYLQIPNPRGYVPAKMLVRTASGKVLQWGTDYHVRFVPVYGLYYVELAEELKDRDALRIRYDITYTENQSPRRQQPIVLDGDVVHQIADELEQVGMVNIANAFRQQKIRNLEDLSSAYKFSSRYTYASTAVNRNLVDWEQVPLENPFRVYGEYVDKVCLYTQCKIGNMLFRRIAERAKELMLLSEGGWWIEDVDFFNVSTFLRGSGETSVTNGDGHLTTRASYDAYDAINDYDATPALEDLRTFETAKRPTPEKKDPSQPQEESEVGETWVTEERRRIQITTATASGGDDPYLAALAANKQKVLDHPFVKTGSAGMIESILSPTFKLSRYLEELYTGEMDFEEWMEVVQKEFPGTPDVGGPSAERLQAAVQHIRADQMNRFQLASDQQQSRLSAQERSYALALKNLKASVTGLLDYMEATPWLEPPLCRRVGRQL